MHFKSKSFLGISLHSSSNSNSNTPATSATTSPVQSRSDSHIIPTTPHNEIPSNSRKNSTSSIKSHHSPQHSDEDQQQHQHQHHNHMSELKRFFKKKTSPTSSKASLASTSSVNLSDPFSESSELVARYGKLGKILGSGAGGSVRLLTRPSDGVTFAVKEFRSKRPNEQMKDYVKKCTAEFCIGSTLNHPNIIKTLDITNFNDHYFEIMEYCPIDFFAIVMSGKMTRNEINCYFDQLVNGVKYLHSMGLAHRDLKLDNCVVTTDGILKIIDFGSAVVFKYPYEDQIVMAHGVMGSDPYLAPEVFTSTSSYDPRAVDIWSLAIIYCCMYLKRFPWKCPKMTDSSFKMYTMPDDQPHDYTKAAIVHNDLIKKRKEERRKLREIENLKNLSLNDETTQSLNDEKESPLAADKAASSQGGNAEQHQYKTSKPIQSSKANLSTQYLKDSTQKHTKPPLSTSQSRSSSSSVPQQKFHGPYRLMRLLPHSARPILSRMLTIDPLQRATMEDILSDSWFKEIQMCTLDEKERYVPCANHVHTKLDDKASSHLEFYKTKDGHPAK